MSIHEHKHEHECCAPDLHAVQEPEIKQRAGYANSTLLIEQMDCPTEEKLIRDALARLPQVMDLRFNLLERQLLVQHEQGALQRIIDAISALDMHALPLEQASQQPEKIKFSNGVGLWLAGFLAATAEGLELLQLDNNWPVFVTALCSIAMIGAPIIKKGWIALLNRNLNINALMSIAVTGALLIGHWPEAAMVTFLFALAERIEAHSLVRARNAVRSLMDLAPQQALVQDKTGQWRQLAVEQIEVGSLIRLAPGERVALDGEIVFGSSSFDESSITGESMPVDKQLGDVVFSGTLNHNHEITYRSIAKADATLLARIMHLVQQAQSSQAPTQRFVDSFSRIYTPAVVLIAVLVAVLPPLLFAGDWWDWLYNALVILVIACPCALVISTPVAVVSALTSAARNGVLIKGGVYLEQARQLSHIALDKTGTLTIGKPQLQQEFFVTEPQRATVAALALASRSSHPVSTALCRGLSVDVELPQVESFTAEPGLGLKGIIDGEQYFMGNLQMLRQRQLIGLEQVQQVEQLLAQGMSVTLLADSTEVLAWFAVADQLKEGVKQDIERLHQLGIKTLLLSGDSQAAAEQVGHATNVHSVYGQLLPQDKLALIEELQAQGAKVAMVGDGINDAPALARADIGIAMGYMGTDTAMETADVALMDDELGKLAELILLSRATARVLQQNIGLALGLKLVFLVLAISGQATMWMAVFADTGASLLVTLNSLRLLKKKK